MKSTIWTLLLTPIARVSASFQIATVRRKSKTNLLSIDDCGMSFPN